MFGLSATRVEYNFLYKIYYAYNLGYCIHYVHLSILLQSTLTTVEETYQCVHALGILDHRPLYEDQHDYFHLSVDFSKLRGEPRT